MKEDLPTDSQWWKERRETVCQLLHKSSAQGDLRTLIDAGCEEDSLLFRLAAILSWHQEKLERRASTITPYQIENAPEKLRKAATLIDGIERLFLFRKKESATDRQLAQSLRDYAERLDEALAVLARRGRITLRVTALCSLIGYVKRMTSKNRDREVSGLLGAVLGKDSYETKHLAQWRGDHQKEIALVGDFVVTPR